MEEILKAIEGLDNFPLTEVQQELVNYLRNNAGKVADDLGIE